MWLFRKKKGTIAITIFDNPFISQWLLRDLWQRGEFDGHKIVPIYEVEESPEP